MLTGSALLLVLGMVLPIVQANLAYAAGEGLSSPTNKTATIGDPVLITDLQVTGAGEDNVSLTVSVDNGQLTIDELDSSVSGNDSTLITIQGSGNDVNASLATLVYTPSTLGISTITVNLGSNVTNVIIDPNTGRAYTIVNQLLTWNQARDAAKTLEYGGVQGYLANVTSEEEDAFIVANLSGNGWIGASDQASEGDWKWMDGPEAGTSFWSGAGIFSGGAPVDGRYNNWNANEPNNSSNEDCAEYIVGQGWNDLNCDGQARRYVVEFGAGLDVPDPVERAFTVTTSAATRNIADCDQLTALTYRNVHDTINLTADIDCAGYDVEPLVDGETFEGALAGNGHTIRNFVIDRSGDSYLGLFSRIRNATIRNVILENVSIDGYSDVGALASYADGNLTISNVHVVNAIITSDGGHAGGLIGEVYANDENTVTIQGTSSTGHIVTDGSNVGGLIGYAKAGGDATLLIERSYADVNITSTQGSSSADTGGLIGELLAEEWSSTDTTSVIVQDVYAWGDVSVPDGENVGGLIGKFEADTSDSNASLSLTRAYARGDVVASNEAGGLIGQISQPAVGTSPYSITDSFAVGNVTVTGNQDDEDDEVRVGGLVGNNESPVDAITFTGNYYDRTSTGQIHCSGNSALTCTTVNVGGDQARYFIGNTTNAPMNTWDFNDIWVKNANVPPTFKPFSGNSGSSPFNKVTFDNSITGHQTTVELGDNCTNTHASAFAKGNGKDAGYEYKGGFVSFSAECSGNSTVVKIYQYGVSADGVVLRKHNLASSAYFTVDEAVITSQAVNGKQAAVVSYTIVDNGPLDLDDRTGYISDPVGLGHLVVGSPNTGIKRVK